MNRREILKVLGIAAATGSAPALAMARTNTSSKLVLVLLRGAVDGLALAAPFGDGNYQKVRGELALPSPGNDGGLLKLDGLFGLHPSLPNVYESFQNAEASIVHAVASPYRSRSHFDGQDLLENGAAEVGGVRNGWLNRALAPFNSAIGSETAIALAPNTPLVLRGPNSVTSWAPSRLPDADDNTLIRLQDLYSDDEFFSTRLQQALRSQQIVEQRSDMNTSGRRGNDARQFGELMTSAARFLTTPGGPTIAALELGGWDTHANQGSTTGALANRFGALDAGIGLLRDELGDAWQNTAVVVVTEFGRTVHVNGTRGTDHGTGAAALVLGGAINGGKVIADWPGLRKSDLYAARDLQPTLDIRSVFKGLLADHMDLSTNFLEKTVFPDSTVAKPLQGLTRRI